MSLDPLHRLEEDHRVALKVLNHLEEAARGLRGGTNIEVNLEITREMYDLLASEVRAHHEAEEHALFPLLGDHPGVKMFVDEHRELHRLELRLADELKRGDAQRVADTGLAVVDLLRSHIEREEVMLFPSARAALGAEGLAEVARRLES